MKTSFTQFTLFFGACVVASSLTGCATHTIHFAAVPSAPPSEPHHVAMNAMVIDFEEVKAEPAPSDDVAIDALPQEDVDTLTSPDTAHAYAGSFALAPHVPMALSFHCTSGEESLGCKAKPVEASIERDFDAILATSK